MRDRHQFDDHNLIIVFLGAIFSSYVLIYLSATITYQMEAYLITYCVFADSGPLLFQFFTIQSIQIGLRCFFAFAFALPRDF